MKYSVERSQDIRDCLQFLQSIGAYGDGGAMTQQAARDGDGLPTWHSWPASTRQPSVTCWTNGGQAIVLIEGVSTFSQGVNVYGSSTLPLSVAGNIRGNPAVIGAAQIITARLLDALGIGGRPWFLVGHSWGGAVAEVVASLLLQLRTGHLPAIVTAGAPRPGDVTIRDSLSEVPMVRLSTPFDAVPHFPPQLTEAPVLSIAAGLTTCQLWASYVHPHGGLTVSADGSTAEEVVSPLGIPVYDVTLAEWLASTALFGNPQHALATYVAFMSAVVSKTGVPPTLDEHGLGGETPQIVTSGVFSTVATTIATAQQLNTRGEQSMALYIPVKFRPKISKVVSGYWVTWQGVTLCECPTLSHARTIRKYLLKFLRTLTDANKVNLSAWPTAFNAFLTAASNPTSGFRPTLNVVSGF